MVRYLFMQKRLQHKDYIIRKHHHSFLCVDPGTRGNSILEFSQANFWVLSLILFGCCNLSLSFKKIGVELIPLFQASTVAMEMHP